VIQTNHRGSGPLRPAETLGFRRLGDEIGGTGQIVRKKAGPALSFYFRSFAVSFISLLNAMFEFAGMLFRRRFFCGEIF
jgi:hypothetical protein